MPTPFKCPHCGVQLGQADDHADRTVSCPGCGQTITVPAFSPAPVEGPAEPASGKGCGCGSVAVSLLLIVVLLALLMPTLPAARESARRTQCQNNLKNIALGLQDYHDTFKTFPAGAMHAGPAGNSARIGPCWWFGILPFTENRNIYDKLVELQQPGAPGNAAFNAQNANAHIPGAPLERMIPDVMRCPSSPLPCMEHSQGPIVLSSYVGIAGGCDIAADSPDYRVVGGDPKLVPSPTRSYYNRQKGVGHVPGGLITASGMLPACQHLGMSSCTDGTSNTMIVGEQSDWLRDVDPGVRTEYHGDAGWDTEDTGPRSASRTSGGGFLSGTAASEPVPLANSRQPAGPPPLYDCYNVTTVRYPPRYKRVLGASALPGCSEDHGINNPLQSAHPGGLMVAFVDGSCQFVPETVDLAVLLRIAIRDDGQTVKLDGPESAGAASYSGLSAARPAGVRPDQGGGPGLGGDKFAPIEENPFQDARQEPLSTFSIDVDTASYSKVRMYLLEQTTLPRPDAVRLEELINYFPYDYAPPQDGQPFAAHLEAAECPWTPKHRLVRIGIKGREIPLDKRPPSNLVFLLDVSGSMDAPNKLPLVQQGMRLLADQLNENDRVAIVVYAGATGLLLDSTTGDRRSVIREALDDLHAGGSTNGGEGLQLAYQVAQEHFISGGINRVILCTDGDFNVGVTGTDELVRMVQERARSGVFLSVLGFGMGNHNDELLEQISNKGNGNYAFIDTAAEARKVLVEQMAGTLITIAKDVKIQVEFNPQQVAAYRLLGYENRLLAAQDFNDDRKDAGEIGAGHTVTALYEIVPAAAAESVVVPPVDDLRYQTKGQPSEAARSGEWLTLKIRFQPPDGDVSSKLEFPRRDAGPPFDRASRDFRFASAVAAFGMLLRDSPFKGNATYADVLEIARQAASGDTTGYRDEFLKMVGRAKELSGR